MSFKFSKRSKDRMAGVSKELKEIANLAIKISIIDFGIPEFGGKRTSEEQNGLYRAKKSKCDGYHTWSRHQYGDALDVYAYIDGKASWDEGHLALVAAAMLQAANELGYKLEWGGLWKNYKDMPHFQINP